MPIRYVSLNEGIDYKNHNDVYNDTFLADTWYDEDGSFCSKKVYLIDIARETSRRLTNLTVKESKTILYTFIEVISDYLHRGCSVYLRHLGGFYLCKKDAHILKTGTINRRVKIYVPHRYKIFFKFSRSFYPKYLKSPNGESGIKCVKDMTEEEKEEARNALGDKGYQIDE